MGLQAQNWIVNILRTIFAALDWIVYSLIRLILFGIFDLSNLTTSSGLMNGIYQRIYVILGVFMAFKLMFSFFQYIVNPEEMSAKNEKGASKLIGRTVVMILALISIPSILFSNDSGEGEGLIQRAQKAFLPMLPRVLLGVETATGDGGAAPATDNDISKASNVMAMSTLQAFFAPSKELDAACGAGTYADTPAINSLEEFMASIKLDCKVKDKSVIDASRVYRYSYSYILSTVVGILMAYMLLGITIDVAKRVFKMIILEVIAPIPIMTLIDPKSSKDGAFSKWTKSLISTFLDIFIKLGLLYIVIMMVQLIVNDGLFSNMPAFTEDPARALYLRVLLIVGLIFFAKEAPKFIKDSLGIKSEGGSSVMGKMAGALTGGATGAVAGAISGRGVDGAITGMTTGASAGYGAAGTGKPSNAWATARDAAGAARTGNPKFKGGIANAVTQWASDRQQRQAAEGIGVTEESLKEAKSRMVADANTADELEREYNELLQTISEPIEPEAPVIPPGATQDVIDQLTSEYEGRVQEYNDKMTEIRDKIREAREKAMEAKTKATSSQKNYEDMSNAAKQFNVKKDKVSELQQRRRENSYTARAGRIVRNAVGTVTEPVRNAVDSARTGIIHGGDRATRREIIENREALHEARDQRRELQQIQRGERFDPYLRTETELAEDIANREQAIEQREQGMMNRTDPNTARNMRNRAEQTDSNFNPGNRS